MTDLIMWGAIGLGSFIVLILLCVGTFFTVAKKTVTIVQRLGKFKKIARPGLNLKIPLIDAKAGRLNMKVIQLDVEVETKTLDNVFVQTKVSVQYYVLPDRAKEAFYKLDDPDQQIESYVFDVVRAEVPKLKLDEVFAKKDDIANAIKSELSDTMDDFGYGITKALVTDIDPNQKVKDSMNEINAAERLRVAAEEKGEAEKILKVKAAEAEAESKALQGKGIADQRIAIVNGLKESTENLQAAMQEEGAEQIMTLIIMTQYFDTIAAVAKDSQTNTILLPHSPGGLSDIMDQMRNAIVVGNQVKIPGNGKDLATMVHGQED